MKIFFIIFISFVLISCSKGEIQTALCNATEDKSMTECLEIIEHEKKQTIINEELEIRVSD